MRCHRPYLLVLLLSLATSPAGAASIGYTAAGGGGGDGGPATNAAVEPWHLAALGPVVYLSSISQNAVRRITVDGTIHGVAGNYVPRPSSSPMPAPGQLSAALTTRLARSVTCVTAVSADQVYFSAGNTVQLVQGGTFRTVLLGMLPDGTARFREVGGCVVAGSILYVAADNMILACSLPISTVGCTPTTVLSGLNAPHGLAIGAGQVLFIAERLGNRVLARRPNGTVVVFAGGGFVLGDGGPATAANLDGPEGLAYDAVTGDLYIADADNFRVRRVNAAGIITTVAGTGAQNFVNNWILPVDVGNDLLRAPLTPSGLAVTSDRRLWIASLNRIDVLPLSGYTPAPTPSPTRVPPAQSCDITGDGTVTTIDAVRILQFVAGLQPTCP